MCNLSISAEDQNNELSMIELQGDLSVEDGTGLPSKLMGDLHFTKEVSIVN